MSSPLVPASPERPARPEPGVPLSTERSPRGDSAAHNLSQISLRALPVTEALALVEGTGRAGPGLRWHAEYPMEETLGALGMILEAHRVAGWDGEGRPPWWLHQIVLDGEVVGDIGFHSPPPAEGPVDVEIGYNVVEALRGRGIATQACRLVLGQAWRDGAVRVRAEADNPASATVLLRAGFTSLGYRRYVIERPVEA